MKKVMENYGGIIIFYLIIIVGLLLLISPINRNNSISHSYTDNDINTKNILIF